MNKEYCLYTKSNFLPLLVDKELEKGDIGYVFFRNIKQSHIAKIINIRDNKVLVKFMDCIPEKSYTFKLSALHPIQYFLQVY